MLIALLVLLVVLVLLGAGVVVYAYNRLQSSRNSVAEAWAQIDVQLARRHQLVTDLVAVTAAHAQFERETTEAVIRARDQALALEAPAAKGGAEAGLESSVGALVARAEDYPDLRANESFAALTAQLTSLEDDLSAARRYYNGHVKLFNTAQQTVPVNIVATSLGFAPAEYFQIDREERDAPSPR